MCIEGFIYYTQEKQLVFVVFKNCDSEGLILFPIGKHLLPYREYSILTILLKSHSC